MRFGFVLFAGVMMAMIGAMHAIAGLAALIDDEFYLFVNTEQFGNYAFELDVTGWGWIHLIGGLLVALAGFSVIQGALWARIIGIVMAAASAIANFFFVPYYPVWSILIIALDIVVIWALAAHPEEAAPDA